MMNRTTVLEAAKEVAGDVWAFLLYCFEEVTCVIHFALDSGLSGSCMVWQFLQAMVKSVLEARFVNRLQKYVATSVTTLIPHYKTADVIQGATLVLVLSVASYLFVRFNSKNEKQVPLKRKSKKAQSKSQTLSLFDMAKSCYLPHHSEQLIRLLEKYGYDINFQIPGCGLNLFLCACIGAERKLIKYMIKKGADVTKTSEEGDGALYLATFGLLASKAPSPDLMVLEDLIKAGCDVNEQNSSGYTALHRAASKGHVPIIKLLLQHGLQEAVELLAIQRPPPPEHLAEPLSSLPTHVCPSALATRTPPPLGRPLESPLPRRSRPVREGLHLEQ